MMLNRIVRLGRYNITHIKGIPVGNSLLVTSKCMDGKLLRLPSKKPQHHGCIQSKCHGLFSVPAGDAFTNGRHVVRQIRIDLDTSKP